MSLIGFFEPAFYTWLNRWAELTTSLDVLSWAELAQGVLSQIEPAWAGSTQLKDWASLSWEDLELSNWARLSWSCFSLSQLELDRYFMNFLGKKSDFLTKNVIFWPKMSFFPLFLGIQLEPGWASSTWLKLTQPSSIVEPAWAELNLQLNALSQLELSLIWKFMIEPAWAEFQAQLTALSFPAQAGSSWLRLAQSCWAGSKNPSISSLFTKISKPFWVKCLWMRNDLPVTGLVQVALIPTHQRTLKFYHHLCD